MIESGLYILILVALVVTAIASPKIFLFLLGATIPLVVPRLGLSIGLDFYKIVGPVAIVLAVFRRRGHLTLRDTQAHLLFWFLAYATLVTCVWMYFEYTYLQRYRLAIAMELGGGIARNQLKMPVQLVSVLGQVAAAFAVPLWARSVSDCRAAILGVTAGTAVSVGAGGVYWVGTGLATVNTSGLQGMLTYGSFSIPRLGGLSGEPKLLGVVLAVVVIYLLGERLFSSTVKAGKRGWLLLASAALSATFSSSAWGAVALGIVVVTLLSLLWGQGKQLGMLAVLFAASLLLVTSVGFIEELIASRFVERLFGEGDLDQQKDIYVFRVFADEPINLIFGYGLGGVDFAIIPYVEWLHLKYQRTPTPGVTSVRLLGDLGIVGLVMIAGTAMRWARVLIRAKDRAGASFMLAGLASALLGSLIGLTAYFYIAGALLAAAALQRNEERAGV